MKVSETIFNWRALGAAFANIGDDEQAEFFRGMSESFKHWETRAYIGMQFAGVGQKLCGIKEKELLSDALNQITCSLDKV